MLPEIEVLLRVAHTLVPRPADAEDLVQDTLVRAFRAIGGFDGRHPRAWLLTIMRNTQINRTRRQRPALLDDPDIADDLVAAAGHKDKALDYGNDVWMRYQLPTQHLLYFGIQAKRGKLDAAGRTKDGNANIAEVHNQLLMVLAHEIFDPETSRRVLVDHAFLVAGGEITKAARNWLAQNLDVTKRSQILFMDRDDILNLYVVMSMPLPAAALPLAPEPAAPCDEEPF